MGVNIWRSSGVFEDCFEYHIRRPIVLSVESKPSLSYRHWNSILFEKASVWICFEQQPSQRLGRARNFFFSFLADKKRYQTRSGPHCFSAISKWTTSQRNHGNRLILHSIASLHFKIDNLLTLVDGQAPIQKWPPESRYSSSMLPTSSYPSQS